MNVPYGWQLQQGGKHSHQVRQQVDRRQLHARDEAPHTLERRPGAHVLAL